jgi:hypothetical protein
MSDKVREYVLRIVYNIETGEIEHLSEYVDKGCAFELEGELVSLSSEFKEYLEDHLDSDILGIS